MKQIFSKIVGTGSCLPKKIITNFDLEKTIETSDEWIVSRTGIKQRHVISGDESTTSMALESARRALAAAHLDAKAIDLIIVATCSPDKTFPSTACYLQQALGINNQCPVFDIAAACAGFVYATSIADRFIRTGGAKHALVIGSESISRYIDWQDRGTCILFGDGAGAVVLSASDAPGIYSTHLHAAGEHTGLLFGEHPATKPANAFIQMEGNAVFKLAVGHLGDIIDETLNANNMTRADIDWLVPHQANLRIIQAIAKRLDLPMERVIATVDQHANTSAASVPLALDHAVQQGKIKAGDLVLMEAFGGGMAWGSVLVRW